MRLPVYVQARGQIVFTECSPAVFAAYLAARGLVYVVIVAAAMLLPRQAGIVLAGIATAYLGPMVVDSLLPMVFLWAGLIRLPREDAPPGRYDCWCTSCTSTRVGESILTLAALRHNGGDVNGAAELRGFVSRLDVMFPESLHDDHVRHVNHITGNATEYRYPGEQTPRNEAAAKAGALFCVRCNRFHFQDECEPGCEHPNVMVPHCAHCDNPCDGDPRTHQGPCARDGLIFCSTLCSMTHKRGGE